MHRQVPISSLVYHALYPNPKPGDPSSFQAHLNKNLVGEVRIETARFYGSLEMVEARYPGLNYAYAPHRKRLGRFPYHAKLFRAFDELGLTDHEILSFCKWEGTLWARQRYERDEGIKVRDTYASEIKPWVDTRANKHREGINVKTDIEVEIEEVADMAPEDTEMGDDVSSDDEEDIEESVGFELNQRLMHAAAMREQGVNVAMDPEWEQYLKEAQERGEPNIEATREALRIMAGQLAQFGLPGVSSQSYQPPAASA